MDTAEFWLRLLLVKGIGTKRLGQLVMTFQHLPGNEAEMLKQMGLSIQQQGAFYSPSADYLDRALNWLSQPDNRMVLMGEADYPERLQHISLPPAVLFVRGNVRALHTSQLAIVGSRNCSGYGERWGHYFAHVLGGSGLGITSGLAIGIDSIAHRGALEAQGVTVAVLGSGLDNIYPRRHLALADDIVAQGGALVSEFLPSEAPLAAHFPRRNRIISGLSLAVLVIEATLHSGSLITARYALEQGREIFALPGSLDSDGNMGCHWLIQQGAYLVSQPADIIEQLYTVLQWVPLSDAAAKNRTVLAVGVSQELPFADVLANVGDQVTPIDTIAARMGQSVPDVVMQLLDLELAGWIAAVPGGYIRIRRTGHV